MDREREFFASHGWIEDRGPGDTPLTPRRFRATRPTCSNFDLGDRGVPYRTALELMSMLGYEAVTPRSRRPLKFPQIRYFENLLMPPYLVSASFQVDEIDEEYYVDFDDFFDVVFSIRIDGFFDPPQSDNA